MCSNCGTSYPGDSADIASTFGLDDDTRERQPFVANYPQGEARIHRVRLTADEGGAATVTFKGDLDATRCWIATGSSGRPSLYAEVTRGDVTTEVTVAIVPTGKRVPLAHDGSPALRLGQAGRIHVYLISVESKPVDDLEVAADAADDAARMIGDLDGSDTATV